MFPFRKDSKGKKVKRESDCQDIMKKVSSYSSTLVEKRRQKIGVTLLICSMYVFINNQFENKENKQINKKH